MFSLSLDGSSTFKVASRSGVSVFATDGSAPNPFEGALATIAACAGVYAHKACAAAGIDSAGIGIRLKPSAALGGAEIRRIAILTHFPDGFPAELIPRVLDSIAECPVKSMIQHGNAIDFRIETSR
ncbi:MAG TPA: OsmC family protein [Rhodocyclaceae bacterium]|nr:OsmC family protein [Rhodocyclaceae bacterium]